MVFAVVELYALVLWLVLGRFQWFYFDEWDFLAARKAGDLGDLFRPHNEHWSTIPILSYRVLYSFFGLRSYLPYQFVVVALHVTAAWLLWLIMRRARVQPWLATAAASLFALLGSGYQDIISAFQVGFTGALVLGLTHLLLADHDGPSDRRDCLGLLAGLAGLMMAGVAVTMVIVVGLAVLLRRGWRAALLHTAPLAGCYLVWYAAVGHSGYAKDHPPSGGMFHFITLGLQSAYQAMGQSPGVGLALAVLVIVGFPLAALTRNAKGELRELAAPAALLVGSLVFITITATGRINLGLLFATRSRYTHIVAAMTLPALAVAADVVARHVRWFFPIGLALFLVGIPGNVRYLANQQHAARPVNEATRQMMLTIAHDPFARQLPRGFQPESRLSEQVTLGWLLDGVAQHRIPDPPRISPQDLAGDRLRLSLQQRTTSSPLVACHPTTGTFIVTMHRGDEIGLRDALTITPSDDQLFLPSTMAFAPSRGKWLVAMRDTGPITIISSDKHLETLVCTQARPRP